MMTNITSVKIRKILKEDSIDHTITTIDASDDKHIRRAIATVTYCNGTMVTNNIELWESKKGYYIQFPYTKRFIPNKEGMKEEIRYNVTHPISNEARNEFQDAVIAAYKNLFDKDDN